MAYASNCSSIESLEGCSWRKAVTRTSSPRSKASLNGGYRERRQGLSVPSHSTRRRISPARARISPS